MSENWSDIVRIYRTRHGLTQERMGGVIGVAQRTISRWERGEDTPSLEQQRRLRDLGWEPTGPLLTSLAAAVQHCPVPRALSRTQNLRLLLLSAPAIAKRPSVTEWIGRDLAPIACGVLEEMLEDKILQRAIARREIAGIVATSRSVLRTAEHDQIGAYRTNVTYFFHEGTLYSDAISVPTDAHADMGYRPIPMDEVLSK
jgi:transcriptional regulator with XRE-family HTH domain